MSQREPQQSGLQRLFAGSVSGGLESFITVIPTHPPILRSSIITTTTYNLVVPNRICQNATAATIYSTIFKITNQHLPFHTASTRRHLTYLWRLSCLLCLQRLQVCRPVFHLRCFARFSLQEIPVSSQHAVRKPTGRSRSRHCRVRFGGDAWRDAQNEDHR